MYRVKIITKDKKHIFISETKNIKLAETCYNTIERIMHDYFYDLSYNKHRKEGIMAYSKALNEPTKRWVKANREKITFTTEKGFNNRLKDCAEKIGMSKQEFIIETLKREMGEK